MLDSNARTCWIVMKCDGLRVVASRFADVMPVCARFLPLFFQKTFPAIEKVGGHYLVDELKTRGGEGGTLLGRAIKNVQN